MKYNKRYYLKKGVKKTCILRMNLLILKKKKCVLLYVFATLHRIVLRLVVRLSKNETFFNYLRNHLKRISQLFLNTKTKRYLFSHVHLRPKYCRNRNKTPTKKHGWAAARIEQNVNFPLTVPLQLQVLSVNHTRTNSI